MFSVRQAIKKASGNFAKLGFSSQANKPFTYTPANTLFYPVTRVHEGRKNFIEIDSAREEMSRLVQQKYNHSFSSADAIENIKLVGERGWVIREKKLTKEFVEKVNSLLSKFKKIRTITVLCCLSEDVARLLSERHHGVKFIGVNVPVMTALPIKVAKIKDGVVLSGNDGNPTAYPVSEENIHIFRNGVEILDETRASEVKALLSSGIYSRE